MNTKLIKRVLGDPQAKTIKRLRKKVGDVNKLEPKYKEMSDTKLRERMYSKSDSRKNH
jgi:preprotein translocase subunit SecA